MLFRALTTFLVAAGLSLGAMSVTACGGGGEGYKMPVSHPLVPFKKPERSELVNESPANTAPVKKGPLPDMGDDDDGAKTPPPAGSKGK